VTRKPDDTTAREGGEAFLSRWSRKKKELQPPPRPAAEKTMDPKAPAPDLPPVEKLTIESDYRAFFHPKVGEDVRRAALKKLFSDPHFNVMDGLDVYIDDYSKTEAIPPAMLAGLRQVQKILAWAKEDEEQRAQDKLQRDASAQALEPPASQANPQPGIQANAPHAAPGSPVALEDGSPSVPAPVPAEQIADNNIPSASEPPQRGPNS
jgi:hypothetical protein